MGKEKITIMFLGLLSYLMIVDVFYSLSNISLSILINNNVNISNNYVVILLLSVLLTFVFFKIIVFLLGKEISVKVILVWLVLFILIKIFLRFSNINLGDSMFDNELLELEDGYRVNIAIIDIFIKYWLLIIPFALSIFKFKAKKIIKDNGGE